MTGKLIVFEGPDGVGKTTLSHVAAKYLCEIGHPCEWISFPGRKEGTLGNLIYGIHHRPQEFGVGPMTQAAKQALHIAAHLDAIESRIIPNLAEGRHVILDRFWWSTWVYGLSSNIPIDLLKALIEVERISWRNVISSCVFLVDADSPRNREEDGQWWSILKMHYQKIAESEASMYPVYTLNNSNTVDAAIEAMKQSLHQTLDQ